MFSQHHVSYLLQHPSEEPQDSKCIEVCDERCGHSDYDHRPLAEQEDRLTSEVIRQGCEPHCSDHHPDHKDRL